MFYDYEDILIEPSEVDIIIEETKEKLHGVIKDEAKNIMEEYIKAKEQLAGLSFDIRRKERQKTQLEKDIEELKEEYEHADKYDMPRKYIDKFVRDTTGNFAPGDKVWIIDTNYNWETCDKCQGKREIPAIVDGEEHMVKCIQCNGDGRTRETIEYIKDTRITSVHLRLCFNADKVNVWTSDSVYVKGQDYAVNPKNIYRSKEEAEKAIKGDL